MNIRLVLFALVASAALCGTSRAQIFVTNFGSGTVGEYTSSGAPINPALISGLFEPFGIAISGDKLFVKTGDLVSEYTTSGALVNQSLISGVNGRGNIALSGENFLVGHDHPTSDSDSVVGKYTASGGTVDPMLIDPRRGAIPDMAVSGDKLFLALPNVNAIAEYTTSGALVNPDLITGLNGPYGIAISGDKLFVANIGDSFEGIPGTIGEYTISGATINSTLISGLNNPIDVAVAGENLFVVGLTNNTISKYATSGVTVNASLISGLNGPQYIAVATESVPEVSSTWVLLLLALTPVIGVRFWLTSGGLLSRRLK